MTCHHTGPLRWVCLSFPFAKEETTLKGTSNSVKWEVQAKWVTTAAYARCASGCMLAQVLVLGDAACDEQQSASEL